MQARFTKPLIYGILLGIYTLLLSGYALADSDLHLEIQQADKTLFDAFNSCDVKTQEGMFSPDLEFYHDIAGVTGFEDMLRITKEHCANKLGLVRTLVPDSMVVYPVKDFGAIQIGEHTFCHEVNGVNDCGTFGFTHVWKKSQQGWVVHRVVSYGH